MMLTPFYTENLLILWGLPIAAVIWGAAYVCWMVTDREGGKG